MMYKLVGFYEGVLVKRYIIKSTDMNVLLNMKRTLEAFECYKELKIVRA